MPTPEEKKARRARLYGWWYLSIGAGFVLLGVRFLLLGDRPVNVILRFAIAAGFFALAYYQFRYVVGRG